MMLALGAAPTISAKLGYLTEHENKLQASLSGTSARFTSQSGE